MAVGAPGIDIRDVIQSQRHHTVQAMQDYTRLKAQATDVSPDNRDDVAWLLVLEQLIFQTEAEARWLDHCEARLVRLSLMAAEKEKQRKKTDGEERSADRRPPGERPAPAPQAGLGRSKNR